MTSADEFHTIPAGPPPGVVIAGISACSGGVVATAVAIPKVIAALDAAEAPWWVVCGCLMLSVATMLGLVLGPVRRLVRDYYELWWRSQEEGRRHHVDSIKPQCAVRRECPSRGAQISVAPPLGASPGPSKDTPVLR